MAGEATTTLNGALTEDVSDTTVVLTDASAFPTSGTSYILVGTELISYTGVSTNTLTGVARAAQGTTVAVHVDGATVSNASDYVGWGQASSGDKVFEPGLWSLDNYGTKLIALIYNAECFEWDSATTNATAVRATILSGAPTASRDMLISAPDRHIVFLGTETTIGDSTTQDDMYIRWSDQEDLNTYAPTATNTAGTQRLADGSKIMGS